MDRRQLLVLCGMAALAGCAGDGVFDDDDNDEGEALDDTDDSEAETTDDDDEDEDGEDAADTDDETDEADVVQFGTVTQFADAFEFELETVTEEGEFRGHGRIHGANSYWQMEGNGQVTEMYLVDGDHYFVDGDECILLPAQEAEAQEDVETDLEDHETEVEQHPTLEPVGTETIDGEETYVFELSADEATTHEGPITYYVSVETGYLRRIEHETMTMDFHSWGEADPIEPPEMDCIDMDEMADGEMEQPMSLLR